MSRATPPPTRGAQQPPGRATPPRTHSMTRATAARRKAGSKCRSTGSHRSSAGLSRLTLHSSGAAAGRAAAPHSAAASSSPRSGQPRTAPRRIAQPPEPGPEPQRPPHAPEGRLRGKGQEKAARRGARRLPPAGKAPHSPFPPAATPQAQNGGRKAGQRIKTGRGSVRIWKCLFQVPEELSCFSEGKEALEKPHTGPRGCGPRLS